MYDKCSYRNTVKNSASLAVCVPASIVTLITATSLG